MNYTEDQMWTARNADLYTFLLDNHDDQVRKEGDYLRLLDPDDRRHGMGIVIRRGFPGYFDNREDTWNGNIDFLIKYCDYSVPDAVHALLDYLIDDDDRYQGVGVKTSKSAQRKEPKPIEYPEPIEGPYKHTFAYLTKKRGIPADTVQKLIADRLLYQSFEKSDEDGNGYNNMVFISYGRDCLEIRGTSDRKYCQPRRTLPDRFWYFIPDTHKPYDTVFITEGALDAVSLYELNDRKQAIYTSMAGVNNQQIIDRIVDDGRFHVILAVDRDEAGGIRRGVNLGLDQWIPRAPYKDWNEMLQSNVELSYDEWVGGERP